MVIIVAAATAADFVIVVVIAARVICVPLQSVKLSKSHQKFMCSPDHLSPDLIPSGILRTLHMFFGRISELRTTLKLFFLKHSRVHLSKHNFM